MTSGSRPGNPAPPYVPYKTWETFLAHLRTFLMPVPVRFDNSIWRSTPFSGATKSSLKGTLQFLGFIDGDGKSSQKLIALVEADTDQETVGILRSIYDERYLPILGDVRPDRATRMQVLNAFRDAGAAPATAEKSVSFFVNFAKAAGVEVHPALSSRGKTAGTRRKGNPNRKNPDDQTEKIVEKPKTKNQSENAAQVNSNGFSAPHDDIHPALSGFLQLLPGNDGFWTDAAKEKAKLGLGIILDLAYPSIEDVSVRPRQDLTPEA